MRVTGCVAGIEGLRRERGRGGWGEEKK